MVVNNFASDDVGFLMVLGAHLRGRQRAHVSVKEERLRHFDHVGDQGWLDKLEVDLDLFLRVERGLWVAQTNL